MKTSSALCASAIKKEFEQNQIDLTEKIKRYYELLNDVKKKGNEAQDLGLKSLWPR